MKLNQKLLERLDESLAQSFVLKYQEEKNRKVVPEEFISDDYKGNFRVRQVGDRQENMKKSKLDAMSTATSNFYKETATPNSSKPPSSLNSSKLLDQSKISQLKQSIITNRITSAQPTRPLMIKKIQKNTEQLQIEPKEQKPPIFALKRLSSAKQQQQDEEKSIVQNQESSLNNSLVAKPSILRRSSLTSHAKKIEIKKEEEVETKKLSLPKKQESQISEPVFQFQIAKRKVDDMIYDTMDIDTLQEITKKNESSFDEITSIQFRFNTMNDSLYMLGEYLSNLQELKLNNSQIESLRLLGTKLRNLSILWISNSKLTDISGIMSMPNLVEFYCSFNNIKDISPLAFHEKISILDIEGNELADEFQIDYLESLNLQQLIISSNPLIKDDHLRDKLYEKLPATEIYIDDNDLPTESQIISDNSQIKQLYDIAEMMHSKFDLGNVEELKDLEEQVKHQLDKDMLEEPDENRLLSLAIKQRPLEKSKLKRPQTAQVQQNYNPDPTSELVGLEEAFAGNPIKAAKKHKQNREQIFDPTDRKSIDIQTLLNKFK
ncbi:unnamed protein product (macronuclear) [Paramecium tetraurelia]|uniref:Leucine Rich Repeat family protein n=1 Tax=Paramecium tetraurelia TaxID=5888 RepID=A0D948_PARTE|nr:uncharacterized protein GSPATT00014511001 [Paramecium tetraurelia]CAK79565.1 unnamed protein product [Paramecium tetraurelia]|eukprot:XP_001446962.1 hypothetical protein (macronuclear) [Paramecium tetraurelia strain d4-2]